MQIFRNAVTQSTFSLGTSNFFVAARDDFSEIACSSGETDGEIIRN